MVTDPDEYVRTLLSDLCEPLYEGVEGAWTEQQEARELLDLEERQYDSAGTHLARALAHKRLRRLDLGSWRLTGDHSRNGELWLTNGLTRLRMLHTRSESDVPDAGPNAARQLYWRNARLAGRPEEEALPQLEASRLLGLWRVHPKTGEASIRVVRTVQAKSNKWKPVDVHFALPRTADDLMNAVWTPDDEDIWFDEDQGEDDDDADGFLG